jgi:hypothetical protein
MLQFQMLAAWLVTGYLNLTDRPRGGSLNAGSEGADQRLVAAASHDAESERGDVPGWVMVTVMTAALVVAILGIFRSRITEAISAALDSVTGAANG